MLNSTFFVDSRNADYLFQSITPELETISIAGLRSSVKIYKTAKELVINIEASDIPSCRAAMNSWLRLALVAVEVDEIVIDALTKQIC